MKHSYDLGCNMKNEKLSSDASIYYGNKTTGEWIYQRRSRYRKYGTYIFTSVLLVCLTIASYVDKMVLNLNDRNIFAVILIAITVLNLVCYFKIEDMMDVVVK
jgi:hypothetical protein